MLARKPVSGERKFDVYIREPNGFTHKVGSVMCSSKIAADTRVRMMYSRSLTPGRVAYAIDPMNEAANA